jgi:two-component system sensor histidine kinase ResE
MVVKKTKKSKDSKSKTALDARDFFISMAAHELRTPLTAINGYIQLLYSKMHSADTSEAKWIRNLLWESQRLTLLINELLEVDRIKTGKLHYTWDYHHLSIIVDRVLNDFRFTYPERTITYTNTLHEEDDVFIGDFDKIVQVITNVVENAAKFSPINSDIIITLSMTKKDLFVSVKDFGTGISEEILPKLFEGYTVHHTNGEQGMGLGMYLVKNILKLHKGTIAIKTKAEKGTTVTITLPKYKQ